VDNDAVVVDLAGPRPQANCRTVIEAIRGDARISSVELQRDPAIEPRLAPDGDLVVYPKERGSYAQRASDRYECDIGEHMIVYAAAVETVWRAVIARVSTVGWGGCVTVETVWLAARLAGRAAAPIDE
jgi:hypothetical protein